MGDQVTRLNVTIDVVAWVRQYAPGLIGGAEIARKATDDQAAWLILLHDLAAHAENEAALYRRMFKNMCCGIKGKK